MVQLIYLFVMRSFLKNQLIGSHRLLIFWFLLIDLEMRRNYNQEQTKEKRELEELLHSARVFPPIFLMPFPLTFSVYFRILKVLVHPRIRAWLDT